MSCLLARLPVWVPEVCKGPTGPGPWGLWLPAGCQRGVRLLGHQGREVLSRGWADSSSQRLFFL